MVLTKKDLNAIRDLVKITIDEKLEEKLNEKLKSFPTKDEFFSKMDEIMLELKAIREEKVVLTNKVYEDHESRIIGLEDKVRIQAS